MLAAAFVASVHGRAMDLPIDTVGVSFVFCTTAISKFGMFQPIAKAVKGSRPIVWAKSKFQDPLRLSPDEYAGLGHRPIGFYFADTAPGADSQKASLKSLRHDLEKLAHNFSRMQLTRGDLRHSKEAIDTIIAKVETHLEYGLPGEIRNSTLLPLLISEQARQSAKDPRAIRSARGFSFGRMATRASVAAAFLSGGLIWNQLSFNARMILYEVTDNFNTPVRTNLARLTNEKTGDLGVKWSLFLSNAQRAFEVHDKMVVTADQMGAVASKISKYNIEGASLEEMQQIWAKGELAFLNYRMELNSVLPDNVAVGRRYFVDGNIAYPLLFTTAATAVEVEINQHETNIRDLRRLQKAKGMLDAEDQEFLNKELAKLELSRRRMGTVLAMTRLHEIFYPEFSRPSWKPKTAAAGLLNTYPTVMEGLGLRYYAAEYHAELTNQLQALGAHLKGDARALEHAQKMLAERVARAGGVEIPIAPKFQEIAVEGAPER